MHEFYCDISGNQTVWDITASYDSNKKKK
jgi:hypothetical protein